ncbi:MAG: hypothetical protein HEQ16_09710 [Bosea sp.]|nr:hypothetical protein [Bosea sp. (in: a-proteobacteria)]
MRKATPTGAEECFVYLTLPGEIEAVTAGRYVRETNRQPDGCDGIYCSVRHSRLLRRPERM